MENLYSLTGFQWLVIFGISIGAGVLLVLVGRTQTYREALIDFLIGSVCIFIVILISRILLD